MGLGGKRFIDYERLKWDPRHNGKPWPTPEQTKWGPHGRFYYSLFREAVWTLIQYHRGRRATYSDNAPIKQSARDDYEWLMCGGEQTVTFAVVCDALGLDEDEVVYWLKACGL